jgi:NADP-dependent 3-hydroxy acid dehydrogenase YdfG
MSTLHGRSAIVTGASRGIGLDVARSLVASGMRVILVARSVDVLQTRATELGAQAIAMPCDVGDDLAVRRLAEGATRELGGAPDVIVNNAGTFKLSTVQDTSPEDFRAALDVNLIAPFLLVRAFLGDMRARGTGHIVTIGSIADRVAFPENGAYAASKFGLRALHEVVRAELRGSGVRASLVSPAAVDTELWDAIDPDSRAGFTPRRDMLRSTAVADAVRFVLSQPPDVNVDELRLSRS